MKDLHVFSMITKDVLPFFFVFFFCRVGSDHTGTNECVTYREGHGGDSISMNQ